MNEKKKKISFIIFNAILIICLFTFAFISLRRMNLLVLPFFDSNSSQSSNHTNIMPGDDGKIYDAINGAYSSEDIKIYPEITKDNLVELIKNSVSDTNYYQECTSSIFDGRNKFSEKAIVRRYNGMYRVELYNSGSALHKVVTDNTKNVTVKNYSGSSYTSASFKSGTLSLEAEAGIADINSFLLLPEDAEYGFTLVESEFGKLVLIQFLYEFETLSQLETYWINLDYGIVIRAETYENGVQTYLMETTSLSPLSSLPDNFFD